MTLQKENKKDSWELEMMAKRTGSRKPKKPPKKNKNKKGAGGGGDNREDDGKRLGAQHPSSRIRGSRRKDSEASSQPHKNRKEKASFQTMGGHVVPLPQITCKAVRVDVCTGLGGEPECCFLLTIRTQVQTHTCMQTYTLATNSQPCPFLEIQ